jgi:Raf kinase inhibitor-like YbhB/YbcL family protein
MKYFISTLFLCCAIAVPAQAFTIESRDVKDGTLPQKSAYAQAGCTGENISPALNWDSAPEGVQSYALVLTDPDAGGFLHWGLYNLPGNSTGLPAGAGSGTAMLPDGVVQMVNDFGVNGYGGPCPPLGATHRYVLTLYALKVARLDISSAVDRKGMLELIDKEALAKTTLGFRYGR